MAAVEVVTDLMLAKSDDHVWLYTELLMLFVRVIGAGGMLWLEEMLLLCAASLLWTDAADGNVVVADEVTVRDVDIADRPGLVRGFFSLVVP